MTTTEKGLPWADCKVAFDIDDDDRFFEASTEGLPAGWVPIETDGTGCHSFGIFRVSVLPTIEDGKAVAAWLKKRRIVIPRKPKPPVTLRF